MASENWSKVSIGLIVFAFINFVLFIAFSEPFGFIIDIITSEATQLGIESDVVPFLTMINICIFNDRISNMVLFRRTC